MKKQQLVNKNKVGKKNRFPSIYRIITDRLFWLSVVSAVLLVLVSYMAFNTYIKFNELQKLKNEREKIIFEINHWEKVTADYKNYRDAYFKLSVLEYQLGESEKSKNYLNKALDLDPNFEKGREFKKLFR